VELPSIILKGKIDRIEKNPSGDVMIIDIKTGTSKPPSYTEQNFRDNFNLQLPLYIWMYMKKFGMDKGSLSGSIWGFHFIEEDAGKSETVYKPSKLVYLDRVDDFLETVSKKIMAMKDFMPGKPGNCFFCPYKGMCPYEKN